MIGKLSNTVKSRTHSALNLENRYLRSVATHVSGICGDAGSEHPLVETCARSSLSDRAQVVWSERTTRNTRPMQEPYLCLAASAHNRAARVRPFLGPTECERYAGVACDYTMTQLLAPVTVGLWVYSYWIAEQRRARCRARDSWFRVRWEHVPHYAEAEAERRLGEDDERARCMRMGAAYVPGAGRSPVCDRPAFVYGRIECFAELTIGAWRPEPYRLAKVSLYAPSHVPQVYTGLHTIDLRSRLCLARGETAMPIEFVQVQYLDACIAVGKTTDADPHILVVMPIER